MRKKFHQHSTSGGSSYKIYVASWVVFGLLVTAMFLAGLGVGLIF